MKIRVLTVLFLLALFFSINAQNSSKVLIADGNKFYSGNASSYSDEGKKVYEFFQRSKISAQEFGLDEKCGDGENFYLIDKTEGNFTGKNNESKAYLYSACDPKNNKKFNGIIVLSKDNNSLFANYQYVYRKDAAIKKIEDLNGDGLDELGVFSNSGEKKLLFTILGFTGGGVQAHSREIYNLEKKDVSYSKIYAEKVTSGSPKFYEEIFTPTGKGWKPKPLQEIQLDADSTKYFRGGVSTFGKILRHLAAATFFIQALGFIGLLGLVIYEFFNAANEKKEETEKQSAPVSEENLPKLKPINCQNCGAGMPLQEGELICPNCGTKSSAPENYFDVAKKRQEINEKIRNASIYLKRANWLNSNWIQYAVVGLAIWLLVSLIAVFVWVNKGTFEPYQNYLVSGFSKAFFALGSFSNCFWVISLLFGFAIWSPKIKKVLPTIEFNQEIGKAENANCSQCGGGIAYQSNDLATVCGYCGVETYRAKLAWKLKNLTNEANQKATFSLIEAKKAVEDAIWEITGTPKVFAFLLILIAILGGLGWIISKISDSLPEF